ncbi:alpha/beta fold hydrolase [Brevundimonas denitrificans]|uniref:alpha/beta fold hydrolase n=1 Tax=Brevundimonas denitrificans TaxID=1443434 RepID=UPI00223C2C98|nr:alpha/beta hydrolase [Brevundimonas denitrificans]
MARLILTLLILAFAAPASAQAFQSERIAVTARGAGPDVILIPGLASTPAVWDDTARALQNRYRVHVVAVNGFGDTAPGANARGPLTAAIADELRRYMAEQELERPAVIGHSMGGQIALKMAADAPGRVGRVMVVDASPFFPSLITPGPPQPMWRPSPRWRAPPCCSWATRCYGNRLARWASVWAGRPTRWCTPWAGRAATGACWPRASMRS